LKIHQRRFLPKNNETDPTKVFWGSQKKQSNFSSLLSCYCLVNK
jgi:hypothetical protein